MAITKQSTNNQITSPPCPQIVAKCGNKKRKNQKRAAQLRRNKRLIKTIFKFPKNTQKNFFIEHQPRSHQKFRKLRPKSPLKHQLLNTF